MVLILNMIDERVCNHQLQYEIDNSILRVILNTSLCLLIDQAF